MSFQAKRLRIQIPSLDEEGQPDVPAAPPADCQVLSLADRLVALARHTCRGPSCRRPSRHYEVHGPTPLIYTETLSVDPLDLPVLKAQLEVQMKRIESGLNDIEAAEQALRAGDPDEQ
jgi:hypothetical protein